MRKAWTREEVQAALEANELGAPVSYLDRDKKGSPDNYILYFRMMPNNSVYADDRLHMRKALVQVTHFHKRQLDSIAGLMADVFHVEPVGYEVKQMDTDYFGTYYRFEIFAVGDW